MLACANYMGGTAKLFKIKQDGMLEPTPPVNFKSSSAGLGPDKSR